ncbi:MAG: methyltransferase domain-containing protein [Aquificales bacterium]|nr:methyltransferase domain-containing protein [Aquificales bacterium]
MISVNCDLCGQDNYNIRYPATLNENNDIEVDAFRCTNPGYGHHPQIVVCQNCGYVYANPRWSEDELIQAYAAVEDETYVIERVGRVLTFKKHLAHMEKWTGSGNGRSLLDIGAYIGVFVEEAQKSGWDAVGVEPSDWAAVEAQKRGLNIIVGTQDAPELEGKTFDVVTMWDVIEHVDSPAAEMAKAYHLLKPGGWFVMHTMDIDSLTAKLMGGRWPWFMDMHMHYFSQKSMAQMLERNGYEVVWSGIQGRYLRLGYIASRVSGLNQSLGNLANKIVRGLGLAEVALPINFGDLFTVYARKPDRSME